MQFYYKAKRLDGGDVSGTMEAKDKLDLAHILHDKGFVPLSIKEKRAGVSFSAMLSNIGYVSVVDKIIFGKNLAVMINAGLPITRSLEILSRQTNNPKFKSVIGQLMEDAKKGVALSEAMKKHPKIFSDLFTAMVKMGEESGKLSDSLKTAGQQLERDHSLVKKVKGAMIYPSIIFLAMGVIGIFMFVYVVPTLVSTFKELNATLPLSTKVIMKISDLATNHIKLFAAVFLSAVSALVWFLKTRKGKIVLGAIFLRMPLISPIAKKLNSARTSRTLSSLIGSGVNVVEALEITRDVLQNYRYKKVLDQAKEDVQKGAPISNAFKNATNLYPVLLGEMIAVGEETGKIGEMLERIASFYEDEVAEATKNITTVIEPLLMIFIGAAVGFFALSMIKPMYSVMNNI